MVKGPMIPVSVCCGFGRRYSVGGHYVQALLAEPPRPRSSASAGDRTSTKRSTVTQQSPWPAPLATDHRGDCHDESPAA